MSNIPCPWCDGQLVKITGGKNMPSKFQCKDLACAFEIEIPPELELTSEPPSDSSVKESVMLVSEQSEEVLMYDPQVLNIER